MTIPSEFLRQMDGVTGWQAESFCRVQDSGEQVQSIRLNKAKIPGADLLGFPTASNVPWSESGLYLSERPKYTLDPLLHAGGYYVQEASSMFLEQAIRQLNTKKEGCRVLDLCAAPGGKSTHLLSLLPEHSVLVSNEVIKTRVTILEENLIKWGDPNRIITNNDPRDFSALGPSFDIILVDAPCSGSGMFRRDPKAIEEWSPELVELCAQRQQRILADIWPCLREGGLLIYSTCSYSVQEDEDIVDWICEEFDAESLSVRLESSWDIVETISPRKQGWGYRFFPDRVKGEGLFLSAFRKTDVRNNEFNTVINEKYSSGSGKKADRSGGKKGKIKLEKAGRQQVQDLQDWIKPGLSDFYLLQDTIIGMPGSVAELLHELGSLYIRSAGLALGKWAGKQLVPDHALAVSTMLAKENIAQTALDLDAAIAFLRKEEVPTEGSKPGWNLATYKNLGLGWLKVLPNRSNNYYPKEWRILMQNQR